MSFTDPVVISVGVGIYVAFKSVLLDIKLPNPPDQIPVVDDTVTDPLIAKVVLLVQANKSNPTATTGAFVK